MALIPQASGGAYVDLSFKLPSGESIDLGRYCRAFHFYAMMNGGYTIQGSLTDAGFATLKQFLIESGYFKTAKKSAFLCEFQLNWQNPDNTNQTKTQTAYITHLNAQSARADLAVATFVGIDPPSWFLNSGDASGQAFRGTISSVITQCVNAYAPDVNLTVSETQDSSQNVYWMMRQDPKTFIGSLLEWSSSLTRSKTNWLVAMDGNDLSIQEQADYQSQYVGYYTGVRTASQAAPTIYEWKLLADNSLSILASKLVTYGASATTGLYLDRIVDFDESMVFAKDATTPNKLVARTSSAKTFTQATDGGPPNSGWTAFPAIPEVYSAGDVGQSYGAYVDGRARSMWLNLFGMGMRARIKVIGHGVFESSVGLGVNTIAIDWIDSNGQPFFLAGNWIVYGFHHTFRDNRWMTYLYIARQDWDSTGQAVPPAPT